MSFTVQELADTANELKREINRFLSKTTKPDALLGRHPITVFASQKQSIAIWHGNRIENHLAEWINKTSDWNAKLRERIVIAGNIYEIDNLAWNKRLGIVLAVEAKRVWVNQSDTSQTNVRSKLKLYSDPSVTPAINSHAGLSTSDFRFFVFDVYGNTKKGSGGLPVIAGDKIENIFGDTFLRYVQWERKVMAKAILEKIDSNSQDTEPEEGLRTTILSGSLIGGKSKKDVLDYIDSHAN
jgi:hypothetical protein